MGNNHLGKLKGKSLVNKLNQHIIASLFLAGMCVAGTISSIAGAIFHPAFILLIGLFSVLSWRILKHLKQVSEARQKINRTLYTADNKSYVWDLENVKDKLMARLLQEGLCPWNEKGCNTQNPCFCKQQKEHLDWSNLDITQKQKILLNEYEAEI
jgi:hypothetical protein